MANSLLSLQPSLQSFFLSPFFDRSVGAKIDNLSVAEPNVKGDWNKKGVRVEGKNAVCRNGPPLSNQLNGVPIERSAKVDAPGCVNAAGQLG